MRFLTTLLTATAVCAAMLAAAAYRVGDTLAVQPWTGLTTRTVLATNGLASSDGSVSASHLDRRTLGDLVDQALGSLPEVSGRDGSRS